MSKKPQKKAMTNDFSGTHQDYKRQVKEAGRKLTSTNKSTKNIEEAFRILSEICNKDVQISEAFNYRGACYNLMGDFQRALYDYSVAIKIAKDENEDPRQLAEYYSMAGI